MSEEQQHQGRTFGGMIDQLLREAGHVGRQWKEKVEAVAWSASRPGFWDGLFTGKVKK